MLDSRVMEEAGAGTTAFHSFPSSSACRFVSYCCSMYVSLLDRYHNLSQLLMMKLEL